MTSAHVDYSIVVVVISGFCRAVAWFVACGLFCEKNKKKCSISLGFIAAPAGPVVAVAVCSSRALCVVVVVSVVVAVAASASDTPPNIAV